MQRDLSRIKERDFDNHRSNDIIYRKHTIQQILENDPDVLAVLGTKTPKLLNKYADPKNPTKEELEERQEIEAYNQRTKHQQIVPYLKLNGIQKEVLNFIMFDVEDSSVSYTNDVIKVQTVIFMCLVHENDMDTEYGVTRTDLLDYLVKDLFSWSNVTGLHWKCTNDYTDIIDSQYYCRTIKFEIEGPNNLKFGRNNRYDRFSI